MAVGERINKMLDGNELQSNQEGGGVWRFVDCQVTEGKNCYVSDR